MFRPSGSRRNSTDMSTTLSIQAGMHCVSRRTRQDSADISLSAASPPSSSTLASDFTDDSLAFQRAPGLGSSNTSIVTILADSIYAGEEDEEEDLEVYEVQRVQTQSMEIQRGVLVACPSRASNLPYTLPPIFESSVTFSRISRPSLYEDQQTYSSNKYLDTTPSAASLASSSVSIDLADFPLPPGSAC